MKTLTLILTLTLSLTVNANPFEDMAFPERKHYEHDLTWAMAHAYHNEVGFQYVCERRARFAQTMVDGSYLVALEMKRDTSRDVRKSKRVDHMVLCKGLIVTGKPTSL